VVVGEGEGDARAGIYNRSTCLDKEIHKIRTLFACGRAPRLNLCNRERAGAGNFEPPLAPPRKTDRRP
jgi:hypothetical protein